MTTGVTLSLAVMHAQFSADRRVMLADLLRGMGGASALGAQTEGWTVVKDGSRDGVWPTAKRAWTYGSSRGATHHLVIQDDAIVCRDFLAGVKAVVAARPDAAISLYANRKAVIEARERDMAWVSYRDGLWGLAVVLPTPWISVWLRWDAATVPPKYPHDDRRLGLWLWEHDRPALGPAPSLVEHGGWAKSTMGHSNPKSRARWFIGEDLPTLIDWTRGAYTPVNAKPNYSLKWLREEVLG